MELPSIFSSLLSFPTFGSTLIAPAFLFTILCFYCVKTRLRPGLGSVPGPFLASITNLYRLIQQSGYQSHKQQRELHDYYGKFVRYGPNFVAISDPEAVPIVYGVNKGFTKPEFYNVFQVLAHGKTWEGIFDTRNELTHRKLRRPINHIFSLSALLDYEQYVDSTTLVLRERLISLYADKSKECDLGEWLQWYAFDVVGEFTYSKRLGFLEQGKDVDGIITSIQKQLDYAALVSQMPWLDQFLEKNPIWCRFKSSTSPVAEFTFARMQERYAEIAAVKGQADGGASYVRKKDMMMKFIDARIKDPENVPEEYVLSWINTNVFAGSDTTGISLRALFYYLLKNPSSLAKLRSEIDAVKGLSDPISWADTKKVPYLDACVKEAFRIHPAVGMILERAVPKGGYEICGRFFEEGTIVGVNAWVVQQDKGVFGDDADKWNPDRWYTSSEEQRKKMERCMLTFGGGARICIGKHISILMIHKIVAQILKDFDIELVHPEKEWTIRNSWFLTQSDMLVKLKRRAPVN